MVQQRIQPLPRAQWTDEAREVFAFWGEPGARENGSKLAKEMVMAQHPKLAMAFNALGRHILLENTVPVRPRELAILRASWKLQSEYIWHFHVGYGLTAGITLEELAAIGDEMESSVWRDKPEDIAALRSVDELIDDGFISDATWRELAAYLEVRQLMDLVFTIGSYVQVSWAVRTFGIELGDVVDRVSFDLKTISGRLPVSRHRPTETEDWSETGA